MNRLRTALPLALVAGCALASAPARHRALNLGADGVGISIGNSREWTGVRLNAVDHQVRRVNGINLTAWKAGRNPEFQMNGVAVGLLAPVAHRINGVAAGMGGVV